MRPKKSPSAERSSIVTSFSRVKIFKRGGAEDHGDGREQPQAPARDDSTGSTFRVERRLREGRLQGPRKARQRYADVPRRVCPRDMGRETAADRRRRGFRTDDDRAEMLHEARRRSVRRNSPVLGAGTRARNVGCTSQATVRRVIRRFCAGRTGRRILLAMSEIDTTGRPNGRAAQLRRDLTRSGAAPGQALMRRRRPHALRRDRNRQPARGPPYGFGRFELSYCNDGARASPFAQNIIYDRVARHGQRQDVDAQRLGARARRAGDGARATAVVDDSRTSDWATRARSWTRLRAQGPFRFRPLPGRRRPSGRRDQSGCRCHVRLFAALLARGERWNEDDAAPVVASKGRKRSTPTIHRGHDYGFRRF